MKFAIVSILFSSLVYSCKRNSKPNNDKLKIIWVSTDIKYTKPSLIDNFDQHESVVCFDYYLSVVNENSDTLIFNLDCIYEKYDGRFKNLSSKYVKKSSKIYPESNLTFTFNSDVKFSKQYYYDSLRTNIVAPSNKIIGMTKLYYIFQSDTIEILKSVSHFMW
jgi:hypothetical protein